MATRSCVIIKVRPEDIGKMFKFDEKKLPEGVELEQWIDKGSDGKVWRDETGDERSKGVKLQSMYIGIYCHWDGYIENNGNGDNQRDGKEVGCEKLLDNVPVDSLNEASWIKPAQFMTDPCKDRKHPLQLVSYPFQDTFQPTEVILQPASCFEQFVPPLYLSVFHLDSSS